MMKPLDDADSRLRAVEKEVALLRDDVNRSFQDHGRYEAGLDRLDEHVQNLLLDVRELRTNWKLVIGVGSLAGSLIVLLIIFIATNV